MVVNEYLFAARPKTRPQPYDHGLTVAMGTHAHMLPTPRLVTHKPNPNPNPAAQHIETAMAAHPPTLLSSPPRGKTVPPTPREPHYHCTHILWGTEIAAENEITKHKKRWCAETVKVKTQ